MVDATEVLKQFRVCWMMRVTMAVYDLNVFVDPSTPRS